jgi:hypothetical protein
MDAVAMFRRTVGTDKAAGTPTAGERADETADVTAPKS